MQDDGQACPGSVDLGVARACPLRAPAQAQAPPRPGAGAAGPVRRRARPMQPPRLVGRTALPDLPPVGHQGTPVRNTTWCYALGHAYAAGWE